MYASLKNVSTHPKMKNSLVCMTYKKVLKVSLGGLKDISTGKVLALAQKFLLIADRQLGFKRCIESA